MPHPLARDLDHVLSHTKGVWEPLRGKSVFITGGTGFVGTWLTESLLWANDSLRLDVNLTILTRNPDAFRSRSPHLAGHPSVSLLAGDVSKFTFPRGTFPFIVHAATARQFEPTQVSPAGAFDTDINGTRHVLDFAATHGTERLLFTSSGAVYGKQPPSITHVPEDYPGAPLTSEPNSVYGQAKRASEWLCGMYARQYGFTAVIARLFAFVGPHLPLDANFAVGNFIRDVLAGGPVRISGDGTPYRSYLYAADLAVWLWTLLVRGESAHPYNVGSGEALSIAELAEQVVASTKPDTPVEIARAANPGVPAARYVPSVERAKTELGLPPLISVKEGIRRTYEWHLSQANSGIAAAASGGTSPRVASLQPRSSNKSDKTAVRMRVADYIAKTVADRGIKQVFLVTGGGAMHLNDAFGR
ncbi:MAG TPA: NAD-dependent epimerase/dehydratase family protein, partial [Terriglobales bacterium]|nr:NAD-dependent epimerase/dehydratase family protein [Terriglobales bacterium]